MNKKNIKFGLSTAGFFYFLDSLSGQAIEICRDLNLSAIELGAHDLDKLDLLDKISKDDLKSFKYVSVHGPGHDTLMKIDPKSRIEVLDIYYNFYKRVKFDCLVLHPGEWIADWEIINDYDMPMAFENMDWRHSIAGDSKSMKEILAGKKFKMVLDINHCYTHDSSLGLVRDMYNNFKDIISHYHISGIAGGDDLHIPLYRSQKEEFIKAIPDLSVPIINEALFKDIDDIKREVEYMEGELGIST